MLGSVATTKIMSQELSNVKPQWHDAEPQIRMDTVQTCECKPFTCQTPRCASQRRDEAAVVARSCLGLRGPNQSAPRKQSPDPLNVMMDEH